jgi:hypothetical protein
VVGVKELAVGSSWPGRDAWLSGRGLCSRSQPEAALEHVSCKAQHPLPRLHVGTPLLAALSLTPLCRLPAWTPSPSPAAYSSPRAQSLKLGQPGRCCVHSKTLNGRHAASCLLLLLGGAGLYTSTATDTPGSLQRDHSCSRLPPSPPIPPRHSAANTAATRTPPRQPPNCHPYSSTALPA